MSLSIITLAVGGLCTPLDGTAQADTINYVGATSDPQGGGWTVTSSGQVTAFGGAPSFGGVAHALDQPIVGMAADPTGGGYWLVGSDGGVFAFGDAPFEGSLGAIHLSAPIVGLSSTASGHGYWLVGRDGGVFSFGDARFYGSTGGRHLVAPIVSIAATTTARGYWLTASDGGVFSFGDAHYFGSEAGSRLTEPITGIIGTSTSQGYWLVARDGGVFAYGDARFYGSGSETGVLGSVIGLGATDGGYYLVGSGGTVADFLPPATAGSALSDTIPTAPGTIGNPTQSSLAATLASGLASDVDSIAAAQTPSNLNGLWIGGDPDCFRCNSGAGLAAASVAAYNHSPQMLTDAEMTFDALINNHQMADGEFQDPGEGPTDTETMFFADNLGVATVALRGQLDPAHLARYSAVVASAANFLVANGNLSWYTNGNINIGNALTFALAYDLTDEQKYQTYYDQALQFAISPPQNRWPGFGFIVSKQPTASDGSDGAGYFAESGGGTPGFDADYAQLQLDQLTRLYLVAPSPEILRLVNMVFNQEWPLVNPATWTLNTSGGTRHPQPNRYISFSTPGLELLADYGGRTDLEPYVASQVPFVLTFLAGYVSNFAPGAAYDFGLEGGTALMIADGQLVG